MLTLLHEDIAIAAGASLINVGSLNSGVAAPALLGGVVVGNLFMHCLGVVSLKVIWPRQQALPPLYPASN